MDMTSALIIFGIIWIIIAECIFWKLPKSIFDADTLYERKIFSLIFSAVGTIFLIFSYIIFKPIIAAWNNGMTFAFLVAGGIIIGLIVLIVGNVKLMEWYEKRQKKRK